MEDALCIVSLEQIITQFQTKVDDQIKTLKESFNKPHDCNLSKALKRDVIKTKNVIATIQEDKFDKKTKDKNSEKLSLKKLDEISFEIISVRGGGLGGGCPNFGEIFKNQPLFRATFCP